MGEVKMKTQVYRVDGYKVSEDDTVIWGNYRETLIATFEGQGDAEDFVLLATADNRTSSYRLHYGRGKWSRVYKSHVVNRCPTCDSEYAAFELAHRREHGTIRCDGCETLFEIDWGFSGQTNRVIDRARVRDA